MELPFENCFPETEIAINASIKAGYDVVRLYHTGYTQKKKADNSPLTDADVASDKIIRNIISKTNIPILSEEKNDDLTRLNSKRVWIVDPLDGTSDFINKTDEFTIMISLVEDNRPLIGVIYCPTKDLLYVGQKDSGAYKFHNSLWTKLEVNKISNISKCRAMRSRHHFNQIEKKFLDKLGLMNYTIKGSSLKVTEICEGNAELYFVISNSIKHWDTCASNCIIHESGGMMTDLLGNSIKYNVEKVFHENGILVTNGKIHETIVNEFKNQKDKILN
tara:strand:+ start:378 stop:1205 length:828 start_codon:yes stop_codon:yes gene_type:complete